MMNRWCLVLCVWTLQVSSAQHFLIRPAPQKLPRSPFVGMPPPSFSLHGPSVPHYLLSPHTLRAASPLHLPSHTLNVPPTTLSGAGHHPHRPLHGVPPFGMIPHSGLPMGQHSLSVPHSSLPISHHPLSKLPVIPHHAPKIPQVIITPPHSAKSPQLLSPVPHSTLRAATHPFLPLNPSLLAHSPNLHHPRPLPFKTSPRLADPRHIHVHHHVHHGDFPHHTGLHHVDLHHHVPAVSPVHHHHFHPKPHGVVIKKTLIKKFRDSEPQPLHRLRRALPAVLAARLATDPKSKVDLKGTLDNVKDATKDVCESFQSPVYHVRDAIGSARDVVFSMLKMSPTGLLVPSTYGIMELRSGPETLGAINPDIVKYDPSFDGKPFGKDTQVITNEIRDANPDDTLTAVQFMVRNGFRKACDSVQHAGDAVHSMRRAVLTVPNSAVKLLYPFYKSVELQQDKDIFKPVGLLKAQAVVPDETPRLVGVGRLLELLRAAADGDNSPEVPASIGDVKTALNERREKYKNYITKIRQDMKDRIQSLN